MESGNRLLKKTNIKYTKSLDFVLNLVKICFLIIIVFIATVIKTEYEAWGVLLILFIHSFYPFRDEINVLGRAIKIPRFINNLFFLMGFFIFAIQKYIEYWNSLQMVYIVGFTLFTFLPAIIMLLHNGKKGISLKYFFYIYYPAQFALLALLYNL